MRVRWRSSTSWRPIPVAPAPCCRGWTTVPPGSRPPINICPGLGERIRRPIPAEDWLRDNYHVVQDQVREIRQDLPRKFYLELPKLARDRVAWIPACLSDRPRADRAHGGPLRSRDARSISSPPTSWRLRSRSARSGPMPIMLRLASGRGAAPAGRRRRRGAPKPRAGAEVGSRAGCGRRGRRAGHDLDGCCTCRGLEANGRLSPAFVVELMQWLRDQPPIAAPAWHALQRALEAQGDSPDELLRGEHQREATEQLAIGNVITTMRLLSAIDWTALLRSRQRRRADPARTIRRAPTREMDFRDARPLPAFDRTAVEAVEGAGDRTSRSGRSALARERGSSDPHNDRRHHVGYYLISRGRFMLEQDLHYPPGIARTAGALRLRAPGDRLPRRDRGDDGHSASPACSPMPSRHGGTAGICGWSALCRAGSGQRAGDQPAERDADVADSAAPAAEARA